MHHVIFRYERPLGRLGLLNVQSPARGKGSEFMLKTDVLVIGAGMAGCIAALTLAEKGIDVVLLSSSESGLESNSSMAQGGVIFRGESDSSETLFRDITEAGDGLCNPATVHLIATLGPGLVQELLIDRYRVPFTRSASGQIRLTQEGAHSLPRIIYQGDRTGQAIMDVLLKEVQSSPQILFKRAHTAIDLITLSHHSMVPTDIYHPLTCSGAYVFDHKSCSVEAILAKETVLATGGLGEVFLHTTNPPDARGDGIAMAFRAGARIMNMEYVQFHPTSLYFPNERRLLLTEALRGEGAKLLDYAGKPFMERYHPKGELASRDVVARAIYLEILAAQSPHLWLDIRHRDQEWLEERFPTIAQITSLHGLKLGSDLLPIVPAAHYSCGGIAVDLEARTSLKRLRSIGEVACTGLHGANRLASTSLLENLVFGKLCAESIAEEFGSHSANSVYFPDVAEWTMGDESTDCGSIQQDWMTIKQTMWNYVGLVRDRKRLARAVHMLEDLKKEIDQFYEHARLTPSLIGLRNGVLTALLVAQGAWRNRSSMGCHYRRN